MIYRELFWNVGILEATYHHSLLQNEFLKGGLMGLVREGKHQMSSACPQEQPCANKHCCKHVSITINGHKNGRAGCTLMHR